MTLIPAYGRDYKSKKAVLVDFDANKDFQIADLFSGNDGRYVNKEQLVGERVMIRYNGLRSVLVINKVSAVQKPEKPATPSAVPSLSVGAVLNSKLGRN